MSTPENLVVTVPIETGNGNATIDCDVSQARDFRVSFMPARRFTFGDEGQYGSDIPDLVALRIGELRMALTPDVWRSVISAVQQVLPEEVSA